MDGFPCPFSVWVPQCRDPKSSRVWTRLLSRIRFILDGGKNEGLLHLLVGELQKVEGREGVVSSLPRTMSDLDQCRKVLIKEKNMEFEFAPYTSFS